jgi:hypothetical protein
VAKSLYLSQTAKTAALVCAAALLLAGAPHAASAKPMKCSDLLAGLEGRTADLKTDYGAILLAVAQTNPKLCVPSGTMLAVLKAVFVHWADAHPELMNMEAWECAAQAFAESYPCSKTR